MIESATHTGSLLAGNRTEYRLAARLAEGGEGVVYRILDRTDVVAKIYREFDHTRGPKLSHLVSVGSKRLHRVAAWPLSVLQDPESKTVGFVMEYLNRWQPLHTVYQTKSRLQNHPNRTWAFLVRAARNLATCVHHVHEAGFVIGDLNESNVLIDDQAMAKLIDVDSFQVKIDGRVHPCKVGKSELLPPELQGVSLEGVERTEHQDRFGLAILLFQTLVFGRHPFSGKPQDNVERSLEDCIKNGHYAFTERRTVPLSPPPYVTLNWLPPEIRDLFEQAFEPGAAERPAPHDWYLALKHLETDMKECRDNPSHRYWNGCPTCPWCELEERWGLALFRSRMESGSLDVDADALWNQIEPLEKQIDIQNELVLTGHTALQPAELTRKERLVALPLKLLRSGFLFFFVSFQLMRELTRAGSLVVVILTVALFAIFSVLPFISISGLRRKVRKAERRIDHLKARYDNEASPERIRNRFEELRTMREVLRRFADHVQDTRERLIREKYRNSLNAYLKKYSLLGADIGPVGREKLTMLHDSGYITAEDITEQRLRHQKDRNPDLVKHLLAWRASLEVQFWSTSEYTLTPFEEQRMMTGLRKEAAEMRRNLQDAPMQLLDLGDEVQRQHAAIASEAEEDLEVVRTLGPRLLAYEQLLSAAKRS